MVNYTGWFMRILSWARLEVEESAIQVYYFDYALFNLFHKKQVSIVVFLDIYTNC